MHMRYCIVTDLLQRASEAQAERQPALFRIPLPLLTLHAQQPFQHTESLGLYRRHA